MKYKLARLLAGLVLGMGIFGGAAQAFAIDTWHIDTDRGGISNVPYNIDDPATGDNHVMMWDVSSGYQGWFNPDRFRVEFLDHYYDYVHATTLAAATSSLETAVNGLQSQINVLSLGSSLSFAAVRAFMTDQATTSQLVATSTFNGFMSGAMVNKMAALSTSTATVSSNGLMSSTDKSKLDGIATTTPSVSYSNRSLNTCFQVSATKESFVAYSVDVDTAISLAGGSNGQVALRTYSDSGCTTDGQTIQRGKAGLTGTVVVGLAVNNPGSVSLGGIITRGRYAKLETTNLTGTPTYTMAATQEVIGTLVQ